MKHFIITMLFLGVIMSSPSFAMGNYGYMGGQGHDQWAMGQEDTDYNDVDQDVDNHDTMNGQGYTYGANSSSWQNWWGEQNDNEGNHYGFNMRHMTGPQVYNDITVDISGDIFVNPSVFNRLTGGTIEFVDENGDGITDYVQNTKYFDSLGLGPFQDENGDTIHDAFQTFGFYRALGMKNFVDLDGDGLCDNYENDPFATNSTQNRWMGVMGPRSFGRFMVATDEDVFVNPGVFNRIAAGRLQFVDDNGDGICDYFQDTQYFQSLGVGQFTDENGDTIHDQFETFNFYKAVGMNNFVDVDGDGICDNYEANPTAVTVTK